MLLTLLLSALIPKNTLAAKESLRVGVYHLPPLMLIDDKGQNRGLVIDLINNIAEAKQWRVIYIPGTYSQLADGLSSGRLDILAGVVSNLDNRAKFQLGTQNIINDWGQVVTRQKFQAESFFDLDGSRVGIRRGSVHAQRFLYMLDSFEIVCEIDTLESLEGIKSALEAELIDAAPVSRLALSQLPINENLRISPIVFNPLEFCLAAPLDAKSEFLVQFDSALAEMKATPNSYYERAMLSWLALPHRHRIPEWIRWAAGFVGGLSLLLIVFIVVLRMQVNRRTRELQAQNQKLLAAERELRHSESRNRMIVESVFDGIYWLKGRHYQYVNPRFCEITGYAYEELTSPQFDFNVLLPPSSRELMEERYRRRQAGEAIANDYEIEIITKSGSKRIMEVTVTPVGESAELAVMGVMRDITDKANFIAALKTERDRAREIFNIAAVMLLILDLDGNIVDINQKGLEILGVSPEEVSGVNWFERFLPPEVSTGLKPRHQAYLSSTDKGLNYNENFILTRSGEKRLIAWNNTVLKDSEGNPIGTLSSGEDITERASATRRQQAVYKIAQSVDKAENITELFAIIHSILDEIMPANNFYIALYDANQQLLTFPYFKDEKDEPPKPLKRSRGLTGFVLRSGKPLLCTNEQQLELAEQGEIELLGEPSAVWIGAPLRVENNTIGVVAVQHYTDPAALTEAELNLLEFVSTEIARVIARKQTDQSLRASEERFRSVIETANDAFITIDDQKNIIGCNKATTEIYGWSTDELIGQPVAKLIPDRFRDAHERGLNYAISNVDYLPEKRTLQFFGKKKDGEEIPVEMSLAKWRSGRRIFFTGIIRDITERIKAQEAISSSQRFLDSVFQQLAEGIVTIDTKGGITSCNQTAGELFGCERADLVGLSIDDILHADHNELNFQELYSAAQSEYSEGLVRLVCRLNRKSNKDTFEAALTFGLLRDGDGATIGAILSLQDITEQKMLETQLRQAQKMEAVGRLAGGIAHDFNNLMTVVIGNVELARMERSQDEVLNLELEEISKAATRAASLTQQLLAFSRKQPMKLQVFNLNTILRNMQTMLQRIIGEDVQLILKAGEELWNVRADPHQIEQVIINLVVNARDAMPNGGSIIIDTENVRLDESYSDTHSGTVPGDYTMVAVSDTGLGMTEEIKAHIFEPFFTTKDVGKGTGLGLSTVYGIVKQSQGNIWVYSEPGKGTTFKVYLPRVRDDSDTEIESVAKEEPMRGRELILVVEDERSVREMAVKILKMQGYNVLEAENGAQALVICSNRSQPVDLVLTDVVMPIMGGVELAANLKRQWPNVKFLYMSGYTANAIVHEGILKPEFPYLAKPFRPNDLLTRIRKLLDAR